MSKDKEDNSLKTASAIFFVLAVCCAFAYSRTARAAEFECDTETGRCTPIMKRRHCMAMPESMRTSCRIDARWHEKEVAEAAPLPLAASPEAMRAISPQAAFLVPPIIIGSGSPTPPRQRRKQRQLNSNEELALIMER